MVGPGFRRVLCAALLLTSPAGAQSTARFDDVPGRSAAVRVERPPPEPVESWATRRARDFVNRAQVHARRGDVALALEAYSQAIRADGSHGPAYLGLAWLREGLGDYAEAERLYEA